MRLLVAAETISQSPDLTKLLQQNGFVLDAVTTVEDAIAAIDIAPYDALLLDLDMLTRHNGDARQNCDARRENDALRLIRQKEPQRRILVLSDQSTATARIDALNKGADDFLSKPFAPEELLARLRALMRRPGQMVGLTLRIGNIEFDTTTGGLQIAGKPVRLRRREFTLLEVLMRNKDHIISRERLEHAVFSFDSAVTPNAMEAAISRLRRNLSLHGATLTIVAQRGTGYRLVLRDEAVQLTDGLEPPELPAAAPDVPSGVPFRGPERRVKNQ